jgi:hypothetical protein
MRGKLILAIVGLAFMVALIVAGMNHHRSVVMQKKCVQQMGMLWDMARSHMLEANLSVDTPIRQADLWQFMGGPFSTNMHCPLGAIEYAPFTFRDGPKCRYSDAHNDGLRKLVAEWPGYKIIVEREDGERKAK